MVRHALVAAALTALLATACSPPGAGAPSSGTLTASGEPAPDDAVSGAAATDGAARPPAAEPEPLRPSEPYDVTAVTLVAPDGTAVKLSVYDAHTPSLRQFGLMQRTDLPRRAGMVFRYPDDHDGGFWMKNTLIPLSIAYFDGDGVVHTVLDMEPCTTAQCPSYPPDHPYRGALEVNQGFFGEIGLEPGWRVELPDGLPPPQA